MLIQTPSQQPKMLRFQGKVEEDAYFQKLSTMSEKTQQRLYVVQNLQPQDLHVRQSKEFAAYDKDVSWLNQEIGRLARDKHQGADQATRDKATETLNDLRKAIGRFFKNIQFPQPVKDTLDKIVKAVKQTNTPVDGVEPPQCGNEMNPAWQAYLKMK